MVKNYRKFCFSCNDGWDFQAGMSSKPCLEKFKNKLAIIQLLKLSNENERTFEQKNFGDELSFDGAKQACESYDAELVSIFSEDENELIREFNYNDPNMQQSQYWIGGECDPGRF